MKKKTLFCVLSLLIVCSISHADLLFRMNAPTTDLVLGGDSVTVTISAQVEDATALAGDGLFAWSLKAIVDSGGIVDLVGADLDPAVWEADDSSAVPGALSGSVDMVAIGVDNASSSIGTDGLYTSIATFEIQAAAGATAGQTVTYLLGGGDDFWGLDIDNIDYNETNGNITFEAGESNSVFTIVPEPATLVLLGLGSLVVAYRRKK